MPELPEVETIKNDLNRLIVGKKILDVETDSPKQVKPSPKLVKKEVVGTSIKKVQRRAKLLIITLSSNKILTVHLKMTGQLLVRKSNAPKDKYQHVTFLLSGNKELRFADLRKFGWVALVKDEKNLGQFLKSFGPEALSLSLKEFQKILSLTTRSTKILLMDQKKLSGIGNIYASDALWLARINPERKANSLSLSEQNKLLLSVKKVLKAGIKYRGASYRYYLDALGHKGAYQDHFLVYNREGKKCFRCNAKIKKTKLGGRGTYLCPSCQK